MRATTVWLDGNRRIAIRDGERVLVGDSAGLLDLLIAGRTLEDEPFTEIAQEKIEFDAPLRPPILLCCGQNYSDHLAEQGAVTRSEPEFFLKAGQTIADPGDPFRLDRRVTKKLDYETELAVVIGKALSNASIEEASDSIFGYLVLNDLSARDRQIKGGGRTALGPGKNFDGATRLAQWVVTADEVRDPQALRISTTVNGEYRQDNTTANMIYGCAAIVSFFSTSVTLLPGTIIATGTPGGTGLGCDSELGGRAVTPPGCVPARYLEHGDVVISEIEGVGNLSFDVVEEAGTAS
jgi:2-keto-4-pentenoate hydratase/2-oxohepta-3-ene-1,7-dioic acid hydratase in catechol pathway